MAQGEPASPFAPSARAPGRTLPPCAGWPRAGTHRVCEQLMSHELVTSDTGLLIILIRLGGVLIRGPVIHSGSNLLLFLCFPFSS